MYVYSRNWEQQYNKLIFRRVKSCFLTDHQVQRLQPYSLAHRSFSLKTSCWWGVFPPCVRLWKESSMAATNSSGGRQSADKPQECHWNQLKNSLKREREGERSKKKKKGVVYIVEDGGGGSFPIFLGEREAGFERLLWAYCNGDQWLQYPWRSFVRLVIGTHSNVAPFV